MATVAVAGAGLGLSIAGWIVSPITTMLLNDGFALLGFDESGKLRELETRILPQLALVLEQLETIPPDERNGRSASAPPSTTPKTSSMLPIITAFTTREMMKWESNILVMHHSRIELKLDGIQRIVSGKTSKLKKILMKLEKITEEGSQFLQLLGRTVNNGNYITNTATEETGIVTTSLPVTEVIIGRDEERDKIINMLRKAPADDEPSSSNTRCYSTIGMYGVGGSGKTTLAQYVCDYEKTDGYFSPIMWIHLPQNFNMQRVYKAMLEEATHGKPSDEYSSLSLEALQMKLKEELKGKRFLLLLDDIRAEKNVVSMQYRLDQLVSPLRDGKVGSKVLVTTRFKDVAMSLGAQDLIPVPEFKENDFFKIFMHYAIDDSVCLNDQEQEKLLIIGGKIVKKLKGSPLAARIVAARLRKQDADVRARVADQHLLTDTVGALWWSYQQLHVQVKRCFAYYSLFPQGYMFTRDELVDLWIAEAFINATDSAGQIEGVCQNYFDELVSCSFLQPKDSFGSKNKWFTIHDLLHELAAMVAGTDCFRVESGDMKEFPPDVRHLFVCSNDQTETIQVTSMQSESKALL
ncbi:putative disease resistance protein At3g14460 [Oryza brachyantha]|uniref:putative disease resistance protein At3g14460 n=1 Tax=Oryza brachyantha TaxID=4533 RepID=UPI0003EA869F|nr:putative disease resistance protein At3g14460 [Oryza brachyantha]